MKKDILFALIFIALGFIIGFWMGEKNKKTSTSKSDNVVSEELLEYVVDDDPDQILDYVVDDAPYQITVTPKKTTTKTNDNSVNTEKKTSETYKTKETSKSNNTTTETNKLITESNSKINKSESVVEQKETEINKFDPNALTVVSFIQDWLDREATISLKNNTDRTVSYFTATIIYKDKKGEILDYQEISNHVEIAPHMARKIKIKAYGRDNDYAYYLSDKYMPNKNRVFKIEFKLNSYK